MAGGIPFGIGSGRREVVVSRPNGSTSSVSYGQLLRNPNAIVIRRGDTVWVR